MTPAAGRRGRLVRLRIVEHRVARAASARADMAYAALADVDARVGQMRAGIDTPPGLASGHGLQSLGELAARLDAARAALARSLDDARTTQIASAAKRGAAHLAERRTESFHVDAVKREEAEAVTRAAAMSVPRRPKRGPSV